jgi:hypothetical protein
VSEAGDRESDSGVLSGDGFGRRAPGCGWSLDDVVLHGPERGRGSRRDADLGVDVLDVVVDGLGRDAEPVGDLASGEALRRETQDVNLASREPARVVRALADRASRLVVEAGGLADPGGEQAGAQLRPKRLAEGVVLGERQRGDELPEAERWL